MRTPTTSILFGNASGLAPTNHSLGCIIRRQKSSGVLGLSLFYPLGNAIFHVSCIAFPGPSIFEAQPCLFYWWWSSTDLVGFLGYGAESWFLSATRVTRVSYLYVKFMARSLVSLHAFYIRLRLWHYFIPLLRRFILGYPILFFLHISYLCIRSRRSGDGPVCLLVCLISFLCMYASPLSPSHFFGGAWSGLGVVYALGLMYHNATPQTPHVFRYDGGMRSSVGSIFFWFVAPYFALFCLTSSSIADVYHIMSHAIMYSSKAREESKPTSDRCHSCLLSLGSFGLKPCRRRRPP